MGRGEAVRPSEKPARSRRRVRLGLAVAAVVVAMAPGLSLPVRAAPGAQPPEGAPGALVVDAPPVPATPVATPSEPAVFQVPGILASILLPLFLGWIVGLALGRLRPVARSPRLQVAIGTAPAIAAFLAVPFIVRVGAWDVAATGLLLGIGLIVGCRGGPRTIDRRTAALGAGSVVLSLVLLETGTRLVLGPGQAPPRVGAGHRFVLPGGYTLDYECGCLFPDAQAGFDTSRRSLRVRLDLAGHRPERVLHVGDSLVEGSGVRLDEAFPAVLGERQPDVAHVNVGFGGSGPDIQYLVARAWLARMDGVRQVVMHFDPINDLQFDLDRWHACCDRGPLLEYADDGRVRPRCEEPSPRPSRKYLFGLSPGPFALRAASSFSAFARHATAALLRGSATHLLAGGGDLATRWRHYEAILRTFRDDLASRGIPLVLVVMPARPAILQEDPVAGAAMQEIRRQAASVATSLGIPVLDPGDDAANLVLRDGPGALFLGGTDPHFNAQGHRWMATWLAERLPPAAGAAPSTHSVCPREQGTIVSTPASGSGPGSVAPGSPPPAPDL